MIEELETGIDDLAETLCTSKTLDLLGHRSQITSLQSFKNIIYAQTGNVFFKSSKAIIYIS